MELFKRKQHTYHVFYTHAQGYGSITMYMTKKINTPDLVQEVREYIQKSSGKDNVAISHWIKLKSSHIPE